MEKPSRQYINRELSWLAFNERVLQEAADKTTPLIERFKFLGIFSSNMDEFFRVRVATIKRIERQGREARVLLGENPKKIIGKIEEKVFKLNRRFDEIYRDILRGLRDNNIRLVNESELDDEQQAFVKRYFHDEVRSNLFPIMIDDLEHFPMLNDHSIYLAVRLRKKKTSRSARHALIEVPRILPRFLVMPKQGDVTYIIILDDVIRNGLEIIFSMFGARVFEAYTIKVTRDAELDLDDDITLSFYEKMAQSLKQRTVGLPVRFVYDSEIPVDFLKMLTNRLELTESDTMIPGGRYHNFKDFMSFPKIGPPELQYTPMPPLPHRDLDPRKSILKVIRKQDILLHFPYQSFNYIIDLLREASIDPKVESIKVTLYRVATHSSIVNALIRAIRNGKSVTVVMELQARFDEEANIYWTQRLREEGARIIHGVPNLKVHSKVCLITRRERGGVFHYANIATGNYNEVTARIYSDHSLLTSDKRLTRDVVKLFEFFENNYKTGVYNHLIVSPFQTRRKLLGLVGREIANARAGHDAWMIVKANSLFDRELIDALYAASRAGVTVRMLIRGISSLIPGVPGMSENISVVSIVDRFLEHTRIFVFCNGGNEQYYISSADWMVRNIERRVEVTCPVYDPGIRRELREFLDIQLADNTKARVNNALEENAYLPVRPGEPRVRAQTDIHRMIAARNCVTDTNIPLDDSRDMIL